MRPSGLKATRMPRIVQPATRNAGAISACCCSQAGQAAPATTTLFLFLGLRQTLSSFGHRDNAGQIKQLCGIWPTPLRPPCFVESYGSDADAPPSQGGLLEPAVISEPKIGHLSRLWSKPPYEAAQTLQAFFKDVESVSPMMN